MKNKIYDLEGHHIIKGLLLSEEEKKAKELKQYKWLFFRAAIKVLFRRFFKLFRGGR
jgi:hypothetical protein